MSCKRIATNGHDHWPWSSLLCDYYILHRKQTFVLQSFHRDILRLLPRREFGNTHRMHNEYIANRHISSIQTLLKKRNVQHYLVFISRPNVSMAQHAHCTNEYFPLASERERGSKHQTSIKVRWRHHLKNHVILHALDRRTVGAGTHKFCLGCAAYGVEKTLILCQSLTARDVSKIEWKNKINIHSAGRRFLRLANANSWVASHTFPRLMQTIE